MTPREQTVQGWQMSRVNWSARFRNTNRACSASLRKSLCIALKSTLRLFDLVSRSKGERARYALFLLMPNVCRQNIGIDLSPTPRHTVRCPPSESFNMISSAKEASTWAGAIALVIIEKIDSALGLFSGWLSIYIDVITAISITIAAVMGAIRLWGVLREMGSGRKGAEHTSDSV